MRDKSQQFTIYRGDNVIVDAYEVVQRTFVENITMAKWRNLADYSPFSRLLVEYMWEQRPPLLPNQFAQRMGVRKQQVSIWLNTNAAPAPGIIVRLARGMGLPVSELFIAAGYASPEDPLFDIEESWQHVLAEVQAAPEFIALAEPQQILVIGVLHAAHLRDRANRAIDTESMPPDDASEESAGDPADDVSDPDEDELSDA